MHDFVLSDHLDARIEKDFPKKTSAPLGYPSLPFSFPRADLVEVQPCQLHDLGLGAELLKIPQLPNGTSSSNQTFTFNGASNIYGAVYAPNANMTFNDATDSFGSFIGKTVLLNGLGKVHYEEALKNGHNFQGRPEMSFTTLVWFNYGPEI
jgi:hypothetical protein